MPLPIWLLGDRRTVVAGGFLPTSLFGLELWLPGSGYVAGTWTDSSGKSRNATQATGSKQPSAQASVAAINAKPTVLFDGSNDMLQTSTFTLAQPETALGVVRNVAWGASGNAIWDGYTTISGGLLQHTATPNIALFPGSGYTSDYAGLPVGRFGLIAALYSGALSTMWDGGKLASGPGGTGTTAMAGVTLGAHGDDSAWGNVEIGEFILYSVGLGAYDRLRVENYLAAKYAIPVTFDPTSISGLQLWLKANQIGGADGSSVATWSDQSGNGRNFTAGTAPVLKSKRRNNLDAVQFASASSQYLTNAAINVNNNASAMTIIVVANWAASTARLLSGNGDKGALWGDSTNIIYTTDSGTNQGYFAALGLRLVSFVFDGSLSGNANRLKGFLDGAAQTLSYNGTIPTSFGAASAGVDLGRQYGATSYYNSDVYEVLVYNTALTDSQRQQVEGYLANKYALPAAIQPFTPLAISGCKGWYQVDGGCDVSTDGSSIGTLYDRSGTGNHLVQATGANKPTYKTSIVNSLAVARFDGAASKMLVAWAGYAQPTTAFVVFKKAATGGTQEIWDNSITGTGRTSLGFTTDQLDIYAGTDVLTANLTASLNKFSIAEVVHNGASSVAALDGVGTGTINLGANAWGALHVGANEVSSNWFNGDIAEIVVYNAALSAQDRATVRAYLAAKYAIGYKAPNDASLIANLAAWYDASQEVGVSDATAMGTIADRSGNARDATSAGSARPLYKTAIQNGRPVYRYDGVANYSRTGAFTLNQPSMVFAVVKAVTAGNYLLDGAGAANTLATLALSATSIRLNAGSNADTTVASNTGFRLLVGSFNGASSFVSAEGVKGAAVNPGANNASGLTIGASGAGTPASFGNYDVAEIAVFNTTLTDADRRAVENYLSQKYAISV